ncbi:MAG: TetR/AcrR family transcriptional regulator [Saprospiraceae bacterium]|nr:TetR/AcrR family transcriptional regulator [Candidatus Vicinibacter affinis]MBK8641198.1 TetR/AcrR family transcriptional regulator [Candidatus Vicinibacter affinis]
MVKADKDDNTREKILEAARKVMIRKGHAGARMQDIADEAGINKALVHYYFRNKESLFELIFKEAFLILIPRMNEIFSDSSGDFFDKIRAFTHAYIDMVIRNPFIPMFVLNEINTNPDAFNKGLLSDFKKLPFGEFQNAIDRAIKEQKIKYIDPIQLVMHIMGMCVFPFLAKPMFKKLLNLNDKEYMAILEMRKREVADFVIQSLII